MIAGETSTRTFRSTILESAHLTGRNYPFFVRDEDGSTHCEERPMAYIPDLSSHIKANLDKYDKYVPVYIGPILLSSVIAQFFQGFISHIFMPNLKTIKTLHENI
jgi:hypothetical protein